MNIDLLTHIESRLPEFSKAQKVIAHYILEHYEKAAFMTASRLGATVGVSESTVVRFASEVGCDGYPQLQKGLQEIIRNRLTSVQRMEITSDQIGRNNVISKVLSMDIERIKHTMEELDTHSFDQAVQKIIHARRIYIIGVRSAALAGFLQFYFNHIFDNVHLINTTSTSEMFEQLFRHHRRGCPDSDQLSPLLPAHHQGCPIRPHQRSGCNRNHRLCRLSAGRCCQHQPAGTQRYVLFCRFSGRSAQRSECAGGCGRSGKAGRNQPDLCRAGAYLGRIQCL